MSNTHDSPDSEGPVPAGMVSSPPVPTTSTAAASQPTTVAALQTELRQLRERLRVSDEWNIRLQHQIQDLLQLPHNAAQDMRQRMQDPDIAIPLLQCYDAVIQEKTEEVDRLRAENVALQARLDTFNKDQLDVSNAVRMAEELAKSVQGKASAEVQRYADAVRELQEELVRVRLEITRALDAENAARQDALRAAERAATAEKALDAAKQAAAQAEADRDSALRQVKHFEQQAGEEQTGVVVQKVQLQLLTQENADKTQELERLRTKMAQALRQASDNHATHLRIVEERHRMVIDDLRSVNRTQELEMLKLRAQLARWDSGGTFNGRGMTLSSGLSSPSNSSSLRVASTAELVDAQTRQAREMEVKRLYGEVAALQLQRDDAVRQYEQLTSRLQRDRDQQLEELQRQVQSAQRALSEARSRRDELEESRVAQDAALREAREALRQAQQELQQQRLSLDTSTRKAAATQQQLIEAQERAAALQDEKQRAVRQAQEQVSQLEASVARSVQEVQDGKERAYAEVAELQRRHEQLRQKHARTLVALQEAEATLSRTERERGILEAQLRRLEEGLDAHKRQVNASEQRVQQLEQQLAETRQVQRGNCLSLEHAKLQNAQLTRARDQLAEMLQARSL